MSSNFLEQPLQQTWPKTIRGFSRAIHTVFTTPVTAGHDNSIYLQVAKRVQQAERIPLQPTVEDELSAISGIAIQHAASRPERRLNNRELFGITGILMQFTSYIPDLRPYCPVPFDYTEKLYQAITSRGSAEPLDFAEQFSIAMKQTSGDVVEALWRLCITSRLYARWFDTSVVDGIPQFSRGEILHRMEVFSRSVAACKPYDELSSQDASGDTYYCWTHAFAKVLYTICTPKFSPIAALQRLALHNGTKLNHGLAHKYKPQHLKSNHTIAANYGNAIGDILLQEIL